jgi:hypothetical protein
MYLDVQSFLRQAGADPPLATRGAQDTG